MRKVLVADDEPDIRGMVESALVSAGFQVFTAEDGRQAVRAAHSMTFDAAVVDYSMPVHNGVEVLATIRKLHPACARILFSGELDLPVVTQAVNQGEISRLLAKPSGADALVSSVEEAIRTVEAQGRGYMSNILERKEVEREALEQCFKGQLALAIQPFVEVRTKSVVGYEALLRSKHPFLNGPLEVVSAAERSGEVGRLGEAVFRIALERIAKLRAEEKLFINLHPLELAHTEQFDERLQLLQEYSPRIVLEITERSDVSKLDGWQSSLDRIHARGFAVAVDDLGAGYSSLSALAAIKPEYMKVDMSIVRGVDVDPHKRRLIELLGTFASATNATLIAEGVETQREADTLIECGAHWLQGYLFGKPML